ncbi:hypothetical protein MLC52_05995 [Sulfurimonas sp. NW15]|uniref:hypothetical protein n=1 Tax=Sulfurimonas sp. NW15 TaxID=2922729 RepID=UPI003DA7B0C8
MKKTIISLSLITTALLFGNDNINTTQFLNSAIEDAYDIHDTFKNKTDTLLKSDEALQAYAKEVVNFESKLETFPNNSTKEFQSTKDALNALDDVEQLSTQITVLAKTTAYLAAHQADNTNESYNNTIQTMSKTILRLSDDIGTMADRIGEMADRIVQTQEIQSKNYTATLQLSQYAMNLASNQGEASRNMSINNLTTSMSNNMQIQNMNQNNPQGSIPMR